MLSNGCHSIKFYFFRKALHVNPFITGDTIECNGDFELPLDRALCIPGTLIFRIF